MPAPCLMLVTEPTVRLSTIVWEAVEGGVNVIQYRDKLNSRRERYRRAEELAGTLFDRAIMLVNVDSERYDNVVGHGVHLSERDQRPAEAMRRIVTSPPAKMFPLRRRRARVPIVGQSVHSVESAVDAVQRGADYLLVGTIYESQSHPEIAPTGVGLLRAVRATVSVPIVAIGGITPERVQECVSAGASGVAVLSPIMRAQSPRQAAQAYREALDIAMGMGHVRRGGLAPWYRFGRN